MIGPVVGDHLRRRGQSRPRLFTAALRVPGMTDLITRVRQHIGEDGRTSRLEPCDVRKTAPYGIYSSFSSVKSRTLPKATPWPPISSACREIKQICRMIEQLVDNLSQTATSLRHQVPKIHQAPRGTLVPARPAAVRFGVYIEPRRPSPGA